MTIDEALAILEVVLEDKSLTDIQEKVFRGCWEERSYPQIAENTAYSEEYIRFVGFELWKTLSKRFGEKVTKKNIHSVLRKQQQKILVDRGNEAQLKTNLPTENLTPKTTNYFQDWGEATDSQIFYGRQAEIERLTNWIASDRCRLIGLLGMGGIGKTSLSVKLAENLQTNFEFIIWRSLRNAPSPDEIITQILQFVSRQQELNFSLNLDSKIAKLMDYLKQAKCLLIIDNLETVLQGQDRSGQYLEGYQGYAQLLRVVGEVSHQSCLVFTSREQPIGMVVQEELISPVRLFRLTGIDIESAKSIFAVKGEFSASETDWNTLVNHYGGNPLALRISAALIQDIAGGNISNTIAFVDRNAFIFDDILDILERQFSRLSDAEKSVMYWLAIYGEPIEFNQLLSDAIYQTERADLFQALVSLQRRSLIEKTTFTYFQQPVISEYVLKKLIEKVTQEIITGEIDLLLSHSLMQAQAKEYIRDAQKRFILQPLGEKLLAQLRSTKALSKQIKQILTRIRRDRPQVSGYAPGNLLNLLNHLKIDLSGYNFSELNVWQAYLADTQLHEVNFASADLSRSIFSETLDGVWSVAFSPDGQRIATGDINCDVRIWQVKDVKQEYVLKGHGGWVTGVCFSPDSQIIASSSGDKTIKLWDLRNSKCFKTLVGHQGWVAGVDFSFDGKTLVSCGVDSTVRVWDVASGTCIHILEGHTDWVRAVAFSFDGQIIASGSNDCSIKIWNAQTGACLATLREHTEQVRSLAFSPISRLLVSGSNDRSIKVWELGQSQSIYTFWGHTSHVRSLSFDATGKLVASGGEDRTIRLWDLDLKKCWKVFPGQESQVWSVAFSPVDRTLASGALDRKLKLWEIETGKCIKTWQGQMNSFWSIAYSPDSKMLAAGCADGTVKVWDLASNKCIKSLSGHGHWVWCVAFSSAQGNRPQNRLIASSSFDHTVRIWNSHTGQCLQSLQGHTTYVHAVSFSRVGTGIGQYVASGSADGTVKLWDVASGQCRRTWESLNGTAWCINFSPDNHLVLVGYDNGTIALWDINTRECYQTWQEHATRVRSLSVSATEVGGSWLVASASDDRTVKIWDLYKGMCLQTLDIDTDQVLSVSLSPDGQKLVTGSDRPPVAKIWDLTTGNCSTVLEGHESWVYSVCYAPSGQAIATGSQDGTIRLWHPETGECLQNLETIKPYAGMNIYQAKGLTAGQRTNLIELGAIE
jgi:WD40 repeat protein